MTTTELYHAIRIDKLQQIYKQKGYQWFDLSKPYNLNIFGVRSNDNTPNIYNDYLGVVYCDNHGSIYIERWKGTTDPGAFYLENPMNVNGTAILIPGQYIRSHTIGLHSGKYRALVQYGTLKVWRDNTKNDIIDILPNSPIFTDVKGLNIHHAGSTYSQYIGKYSAGCQVFAYIPEFDTFMSLIDKSAALYGDKFSYTLLTENDFN